MSTQDDPAAAFVRELEHWRRHRGLSKKDLARRTGFHPSYVSHIESRRHHPTAEFARRAEVALESGNRIWQRYVAYAERRAQGGRLPFRDLAAAPPPIGSHLVIEDEQVTLSLVDGWYELHVRRVLHSLGTLPITRCTVRIDIDRFPDDQDRSLAFHSRHPLTLDEVDFRATIGDGEPEPLTWRVMHRRDAFIELVLLFTSNGVSLPLYPGERTVINYAYRVPKWKFGNWLQRDIRLPTSRLLVRLNFPATTRLTVWGSETSFTAENCADVRQHRPERDEVLAYEWEIPRPRLRAQYRLNWRYADETR
ncbi:Helix-turn-helix domain-containing protein [Micromonospora viridifaciens]|uniref:Helix-turn-helix domain-containing protein n=1 Tax=Micromonospora viridifaciens TaxID=1881 RepID=A0A1C4Y957_MICVI|nr:helix-turn-helix transcriptional regulator [Micromonospora viridifaciens]SCF17244.1 Helix-turn-helix domain-containing protein [Micromonospora viridifaciens]